MGLTHLLIDAALAWALVLWTRLWALGLVSWAFSVGWKNKTSPAPARRKVVAWTAGCIIALPVLLAGPAVILWLGATHGYWITVAVQAAVWASTLFTIAALFSSRLGAWRGPRWK